MFRVLLPLLIFFSAAIANAYPNFIGYGYTNCVTCHFNTLGHGPLNDYGRALFSQEIAARAFWAPKETSDEELADGSGFIPGVELPFWIRPGLKYRGLWAQNSPGSDLKSEKFYPMQREVNLVVQSGATGKFAGVMTYNLLIKPADYYGTCGDDNKECVSGIFREMYLRWQATKKLYVSAGLMDKAYGIRQIDHTSATRVGINIGQFDQTHGLTLHWMEPTWDIAVQAHLGNMFFEEPVRHKGFSATGEYEIGEKHRLGGSVLMTSSETTQWSRYAIHDRWGLSKSPGTSLMWEAGIFRNLDKATDKATVGAYGMVEMLVHLKRGYNLLSSYERSQTEIKAESPDRSRWGIGFLTFPLPRTEFRAQLVNGKGYSLESSTVDSWQAQCQLHLSL